MSHSYVSSRMHCVFSTKERGKLIDENLESRLWPYIIGIARKNGFQIAAIGGMPGSYPSACALARNSLGEQSYTTHKRRIVKMDPR